MKTTHLVLMSAFYCLQIHAVTLPVQPTKSYECDTCDNLSHETLEDKWSISNKPLDQKSSNLQKSYGYKEQVTLKQLQEGVVISTLAPGAIVRITPLQKKSIPQLILKTPTNKLLDLKEASSLFTQDEELADTLFAANHQTMLQIKPELGSGKFIIKSKIIEANNSDTYLINVFDKYSSAFIEIQSDSTHYQYGDKFTATITLMDDEEDYSIDDIDVSLVGPKGQEEPVKLTQINYNTFEASTTLDSELNTHGENWYIEAEVLSEFKHSLVKRNGHTAFSYSVPSASVLSLKKLSSKQLTFVATLDIATASRYALQSVLFHKNDKGKIVPVETAQKAQWMKPGKHLIQFTFDNSGQLSDDSLYLGYLRLIDYGQLKTVYQYDHPIKLTHLVE